MDWVDAEQQFDHELLRETTLVRTFEEVAADHVDQPAQQYKGGIYDRALVPDVLPAAPEGAYAELSYGEMREVVRNLAAGFRELGVRPGDRVGIFSDTRMEWAMSDFGLLAAGGVVTTVYKDSSPAQARYLLGDSGASGVVVENGTVLERVLAVEESLDLEFVVVMDELPRDHPGGDRADVHTLADVHETGRERYGHEEYQSWVDAIEYDDLATLVYTSGTTGRPKGVKLTHRNVRSNLNQVFRRYGPRPDKGPDVPVVDGETLLLSYLPLAHILERTVGHFLTFAVGGTVAYAESPDTLQEDFGLVEPTTAINVPRIFERIYDGMREQASESPLKERIFEWATDVGRRYHRVDRPGIPLRVQRWLADRLVFDKVKEGLGGNVEILTSGGGTLSRDLAELYQGMGLRIYEGYGLTETSPVVTTNPPEQVKPGTIGPPAPGVEVKVDRTVAPEGELTATMGDVGELLVRGPNVFEGYWNKPEETEAAFTEDGWFRTGDIVTIRPDDYLVFHERDKQILVLSTGKNVAPAPIEDAFAASDVVEQAMVLGDGRKFVGAILVPNFEGLRNWADRQGIDLPADPEAVCADERVRERVGREVEAINERFEDHERIGDFRLVPEEFTQENGLLTPTLKKKRRKIREKYAAEIESIYADAADEESPAEPAAHDD